MLRPGFDDLTVNLAHTSIQELSKSPGEAIENEVQRALL